MGVFRPLVTEFTIAFINVRTLSLIGFEEIVTIITFFYDKLDKCSLTTRYTTSYIMSTTSLIPTGKASTGSSLIFESHFASPKRPNVKVSSPDLRNTPRVRLHSHGRPPRGKVSLYVNVLTGILSSGSALGVSLSLVIVY